MDYRLRYIKYKQKYLDLKKKLLGGSFIDPLYPPDFIFGNKNIRAIILPHAGSRFVKEIMDYIFNGINCNTFDRIILLSTNHNDSENYEFDSYEDVNIAEHSIQSVKPYIDRIKQNKIIKIYIIGKYSEDYIKKINQDKTLIIANTDLLHCGKSYNKDCPDNIEEYNMKIIKQIINKEVDISRDMCGYHCIKTFLSIIKKLELEYSEFIYDSSDKNIKSDKNTSVGYCGIIFNSKTDSFVKNSKLDFYAKKILEGHFNNLYHEFYLHIKNIPGVFVTIRKNKELRGCIGTFNAKYNILKSIQEMTMSAAFNDLRFNPIKQDELVSLEYEVTLLRKPFEVNKSELFNKFIIGLHGITIYFTDNTSATYLAEVMIEHFKMEKNKNLTDNEFITIVKSLKDKAGSNGDIKKIELYKCL